MLAHSLGRVSVRASYLDHGGRECKRLLVATRLGKYLDCNMIFPTLQGLLRVTPEAFFWRMSALEFVPAGCVGLNVTWYTVGTQQHQLLREGGTNPYVRYDRSETCC